MGLVDMLVTDGIFTRLDMSRVKGNAGPAAMSFEVIDILMRKPDIAFDGFIDALNKTDNDRVVRIMNGEIEPPLSEIRRRVIRNNRDKLIESIDSETSLIVDKLYAKGAINDTEKRHRRRPVNVLQEKYNIIGRNR